MDFQKKIALAEIKQKPYKVFDSNGLYLLIHPTRGKTWRFRYRFGNRESMLSFGKYPSVSIEAARTLRDGAKQQIQNGIDPARHKKQAVTTATKKLRTDLFRDALIEYWGSECWPQSVEDIFRAGWNARKKAKI